MKILIFINDSTWLYKLRYELVEKLQKNHEVYLSLPNGKYISEFVKLGCYFVETNYNRRGINIFREIKLLLKYMKIIKTIHPDIILSYTIKPNIYGGIAAQLTRTPYICNVTGIGSSITNGGMIQKIALTLYKIGLRRSHCIFFQNSSNQELFINKKIIKNQHTRLIPGSGVNLNLHNFEDYPEPSDTVKFLFVGRLVFDKGVRELIEAAKYIKSKYPNTEFNLIGFCEEEFQAEFDELNKDNTVNWLGYQDDVHSFIKTHHATILPSFHEGMANVLLESAASGRPVLASNIPGCKETFDEDISGFGFEAKNVRSLIKSIEKFIHLPYVYKINMGIAGRKKVEKEFDRNIIINSYMEEIDRIQNESLRKNN